MRKLVLYLLCVALSACQPSNEVYDRYYSTDKATNYFQDGRIMKF